VSSGLAAVLLAFAAVPLPAAAATTIDCASLPGTTIAETLVGNVEISTNGTICAITGTVVGNVTVRDESADCAATRPPFTALDLFGGTVTGNVRAAGGQCVMVWLGDGATVGGNVIYSADGNLGFLGEVSGSTVRGNVILHDGLLWATGAADDSRIEGNLICAGGTPLGGIGSGSPTDWDGVDADHDGTIGGQQLGC
jgi:hypothetical protein